jgi:hypothetical protein
MISVGDLVVVTGAACVCTQLDIGKFSTVEEITVYGGFCRCCGKTLPPCPVARVTHNGAVAHKPLSWLKRIPPLEELERIEEAEGAPA